MADVRFLDLILGDGDQTASVNGAANGDEDALDAYSRVITRVADRLIPSVGNLRVSRRGWGGPGAQGGGSGVVITPDGFMLTSAHLVAGVSPRGGAVPPRPRVWLGVRGVPAPSPPAGPPRAPP